MPFNQQQLNNILNQEPFEPYKLLDLITKEHPNIYNKDAGLWEKYTLRQHTLMVMHQFEKYFASRPLPANIETSYFRLFLALHDIGKPKAIASGGKHLQHQYTAPMVKEIFNKLEIDELHTNLAVTLVTGDPIGKYIRGKISNSETKKIIIENAKLVGLETSAFFELQLIAFKVDAGSYTEDAGGKYSLDKLFDFNSETKTLDFSKKIQQKIDLLT